MVAPVIAAIPTRYKGVNFRSRLEARWAAFFDLMQWQWHYEPIDMQGWIPDFIMGSDLNTGLLVEVKPIDWEPLSYNTSSYGTNTINLSHFGDYRQEACRAIQNINGHKAILFCGLRPYRGYVGWFWDAKLNNIFGRGGFHKPLSTFDRRTGIWDFALGSGPRVYPGAMTGKDYSDFQDGHPIERFRVSEHEMDEAWDEAGNRTQWRSPYSN